MDEQTGAGGEYGRTQVQVRMDGGKGQKMEINEVWAAKLRVWGEGGAGGGTITEGKHEKHVTKSK